MTASLLPKAKTQFFDSNGKPLAGGVVYFYIPNTSTFKSTWQDPSQTILNTNPVILDASGEALIWGAGTYRQVVYDVNSNLIWDQLTQDPNSGLTGSITDDVFVAGTDFTPGVTTQLTLTVGPGSIANTWIFFDGVYQDDAQASLSGTTTLVFGGAIPVGISKVTVKIGATYALGTIMDSNIASGTKLYNRITDLVDVKDLGAKGDGTTNDSAAFAYPAAAYYIGPSSGDYLINQNATVTADMWFMGGVITVPAGVTLTINGSVIAPSKVIFRGAGTVVVNKGIIDVAWFDGADASTKTAFCLRGVSNTNGTGKILAYYPPAPTDTWATPSANAQWGYGWKVSAPIRLEQTQNYTMYLTYSCFIATAAMEAIFTLGYAGVGSGSVLKADGQIFPVRLKTDGSNGLANWAVRIYGSSHSNFPHCEFYYSGGIALTPESQMQCSDISIGFVDTGALTNQAVLMDGTYGANNTITDIEIGFVNSTGFYNGKAADSVVKIGSNCNGITVRKVSHRAVTSGPGGAFQDATTGVVFITNGGTLGANVVSCRYGMNIGPVINGSLTITADAIVTADASAGAAAKMTGITIESGSEVDTGSPPGSASISLNYTSGAIVQGMPGPSATNGAGQIVRVNSTCVDTRIYGVIPSQVSDGGVNTLIDGHNYGAVTSIAAPGSGGSWTNTNHFPVFFSMQGGTLTNMILTRGSGTCIVANSGTAAATMMLPGDSVQISYTGSPSFFYTPM
jgi:hypothetical protein